MDIFSWMCNRQLKPSKVKLSLLISSPHKPILPLIFLISPPFSHLLRPKTLELFLTPPPSFFPKIPQALQEQILLALPGRISSIWPFLASSLLLPWSALSSSLPRQMPQSGVLAPAHKLLQSLCHPAARLTLWNLAEIMLCTCSNPSHVISMRSISTGGLQALGSLAGFLSDLTSFYFSSPSLPPAILAFLLCLKCARPLPSSRPCTYCFLYLKPRDTMSPSFPHSHLCINFPDSA